MKTLNLIPIHRRVASRRSRRLRAWIFAGATHLLLAISAALVARWSLGSNPAPLESRLRWTAGEIEKTNQAIAAVQNERRSVVERLKFYSAIADAVDHAALLSTIADQLGEEAMLGGVRIVPLTTPSPQQGRLIRNIAILPATRYRVELRGHARSQPAVSQLLLNLQNIRLFSNVRLVRTGREPFLDFEAVAFQIDCQLSD